MSGLDDQASEAEEEFRARAIAVQAAKAPLVGDWKKLSSKWCESPACGERIPDERRKALPGVKLCLDCQDRKEREGKAR